MTDYSQTFIDLGYIVASILFIVGITHHDPIAKIDPSGLIVVGSITKTTVLVSARRGGQTAGKLVERVAVRLLELSKANPRLDLERVEHEESGSVIVQGFFTVPENRDQVGGRTIRIGMIVLPARSEDPAPDPVFVLTGIT